jgi:ribosomal protein S18 acetylase RimI-like enzyme
MGPLQIARFMRGAKRFDRAGMITIGVRDAYRGRGIGATLTASLYRHYEELGLRGAFYYPVNERNTASRRLAESFGGRGRVLYAVFEKTLA